MGANGRIGAEQLTFAKILSDTAGGSTTYNTPFAITKKLVALELKNGDASIPVYADDQIVDEIIEEGDITVDLSLTDLTEDEKALIFGQTMSAGIRTPALADDRPSFCISWKSKKRDGTYKYYKLLKIKFRETGEGFDTKTEKQNPQGDKISGNAVRRLSDGLRRRVADASSATYIAGTGSGWFTNGDITADAVAPTVTIVPADAATAIATSAVVVWTFSEAIQPSLATTANFILSTAAGVAKAGTVTINAANTIVTFTPTTALAGSATVYIATATANVKDMSGNALAANSSTKFTTA